MKIDKTKTAKLKLEAVSDTGVRFQSTIEVDLAAIEAEPEKMLTHYHKQLMFGAQQILDIRGSSAKK
jgi:hypothetical protein